MGELEGGRGAAAAQWAPLLCAAHCMVVPLLALLIPALGAAEAVEGVLMLGAAALALPFVVTGLRAHGCLRVLLPVSAGLALWALGASAAVSAVPEVVFGVGGGVLLFAGLRWNAALSAAAARCGCTHCGSR
jgi:hypothetical protein